MSRPQDKPSALANPKPASPLTIRQFARAVGVSTGTVSRVLNGHPAVSDATRLKVLKSIEELGYHPSPTARALSTGRTQVISVWIGNLNSRYVTAFLGQIEQHLNQVEYEIMLRNLWHLRTEDPLKPIRADGIIVLDETWWVDKLKEDHVNLRIPVVSMGKMWVPSVDHVGLDLTEGMMESVRHLIDIGCSRVAYVVPTSRNSLEDIQCRAYHAAMKEAGREPELIETPRIGDRPLIEERMERYLEDHPCPDGLLCHNDDHALAVCRTLRRHGIRIPTDAAVVGCNGLLETEYLEHPLSTIVLPVAEACAAAWQLLENRMSDPSLPLQSVVLKPRLEIRATSRR